jgi:D-glycero-beta-D-manno-heptose 1-phosphate adenylyltransferase
VDRHSKIRTLEQIDNLRPVWRSAGRIFVWTNGCFDLIHAGHVRSLRAARGLGDVLVVGLNSDASVRAIKGPGRPLICEQERAEIVSAFEFVDQVAIFDDLEPSAILRRLQPDIHCKGAEYAPGSGRPVPERDVVLEYGGRIEFLPFFEGHSTTELLARIAARHAAENGFQNCEAARRKPPQG